MKLKTAIHHFFDTGLPTKMWLAILLIAVTCVASCMGEICHASPTINLEIIKQIESGGDPHAYNKRSGATGLYQITPICLKDFNQFSNNMDCGIARYGEIAPCNYRFYSMDDMFLPDKNRKVAHWYMNTRIPQLLKHFGHEDTLENRLISYNCGVGCVGKKLPKETVNYIKKYRRLNGR